jgi:hypothetical protein
MSEVSRKRDQEQERDRGKESAGERKGGGETKREIRHRQKRRHWGKYRWEERVGKAYRRDIEMEKSDGRETGLTDEKKKRGKTQRKEKTKRETCFAPSPRRPYVEDKRMVLEHTHGLFIT